MARLEFALFWWVGVRARKENTVHWSGTGLMGFGRDRNVSGS